MIFRYDSYQHVARDLFHENYYIILIIGYYDGNIYFFSNAICTALIVITLS